MRRSIFLPLSVALLVVAAGLELAGTASSSTSAVRPSIVCPLAASVAPCCGPPIAGEQAVTCCGPITVPCLPALSIVASPDPAQADHSVVVSGVLNHSSGAGTAVVVWQQLLGQTGFSRAGQTSTDAAGSYSITLAAGAVQTDGQLYATAGDAQSPTIFESVSAVVTLSASRTSDSSTLTGRVVPSHAGERILLERLTHGRWQTIARPRLDSASKFSVRYSTAPKLRATLRAVLRTDRRNVRSDSRELTALVLPGSMAH